MVGDLVVAREGRVDGRPAAHHVGEDAEDDQVAHDHADAGPHQRVDAAAVAARAHVAADRAAGRPPTRARPPRRTARAPGSRSCRWRRTRGSRGWPASPPACRLTVRITSSASPESRFPRLPPPSTSRPFPVACRRSISAQSSGAEHVISLPDSFSTQRNAGMSSFEPSRMPAWLAPVCDEKSVSHSTQPVRALLEPAGQLGRVAVAHRPLEHRGGRARRSRGRSARAHRCGRPPPWRRATRRTIRIV